MLKKPSHNSDAIKDVPADNPSGAMDRFTDGLRRVLTIPKRELSKAKTRRYRKPAKAS